MCFSWKNSCTSCLDWRNLRTTSPRHKSLRGWSFNSVFTERPRFSRNVGLNKNKAWQLLAESRTLKAQTFHGNSTFLLRRRLITAKNVHRNIVFQRWLGVVNVQFPDFLVWWDRFAIRQLSENTSLHWWSSPWEVGMVALCCHTYSV